MSTISNFIVNFLILVGAYTKLVKEIWRDITSSGIPVKETIRQLLKIGRDSLPIVLLTAIFSGMVLALQTAYGLHRFGAKNYVGNVVGLGLVRELGPVLTAVMLCGRVGAGIAAEIASMVVTEQVDAMRALGANPIRKLVTPKIVAGLIALPLLVVFADVIGILGGQLVAVYELGLTGHRYQSGIYYTLVIRDVIDGLIKAGFFGFILVSLACFFGLRTTGGTEGVGKTTTVAVVVSSITVFISNFFITKFLLMLG
jgi:phospholipid/cholesterol/gamma-HCH transport system permease protein